jgi:hypothetical protein
VAVLVSRHMFASQNGAADDLQWQSFDSSLSLAHASTTQLHLFPRMPPSFIGSQSRLIKRT